MSLFEKAISNYFIILLPQLVYYLTVIKVKQHHIKRKSRFFKYAQKLHLFNMYFFSIVHSGLMIFTLAVFNKLTGIIFCNLIIFITFNICFLCIKKGVQVKSFFFVFCFFIILAIFSIGIVVLSLFCDYEAGHPMFEKYFNLVVFTVSLSTSISISNCIYFYCFLENMKSNISSSLVILNMMVIENVENVPEDCPICLDNLKTQKTVKTDCEHHFHEACLTKSLETSTKCPMCRRELDTYYFCV
jgi:hypothetical protein